MADHSVWYPGAPPAEPTLANDSEGIVTATAIYLEGASKYCVGAAWRVPEAAVASLPATVTIALRLVPKFTDPDLTVSPDRSGVATVAAGWCVTDWDEGPIEVDEDTAMWFSTEDSGNPYLYIPVGVLGAPPIQATDGSNLFLAEADTGAGLQHRGHYRYLGPSGSGESQHAFAHDARMRDTLTPPQPASITVAAVSGVSLSAGVRRPATIAVAATSGVRLTATGGIAATLPAPLTLEITGPGLTLEIEGPGLTLEIA